MEPPAVFRQQKIGILQCIWNAFKRVFLVKLWWHIQPWNTWLWKRQLGQRKWVTEWLHITSHPAWECVALQRGWRRAKGLCSVLESEEPFHSSVLRLLVFNNARRINYCVYIRVGCDWYQMMQRDVFTEKTGFGGSNMLNFTNFSVSSMQELWDRMHFGTKAWSSWFIYCPLFCISTHFRKSLMKESKLLFPLLAQESVQQHNSICIWPLEMLLSIYANGGWCLCCINCLCLSTWEIILETQAQSDIWLSNSKSQAATRRLAL